MSTVRLKRLTADHKKLADYVRLHPRVRLIQAEGDPPERYQLEYRINSVRMVGEELQSVKSHLVEIVLPRNYPRTPPQCRMLSPVFHPNIAPHAICVGDHWSSGEPLVSIVTRIGELLAYQVYNVKSPLNGEAARWVEQNREKLPLDPVSLLVEEEIPRTNQPQTLASQQVYSDALPVTKSPLKPPKSVAENCQPMSFTCPACQKPYRFRADLVGHKLKCTHCDTVFVLPATSAD
jgi:ubiquitin-protein ligase